MSTFKAIGVNRLDEPGPMVNVRVFDSLQKAQDFLQAFAGGIVLDSENTTVFQCLQEMYSELQAEYN